MKILSRQQIFTTLIWIFASNAEAKELALALGGGGILSVADMTGMTAGLLGVSCVKNPEKDCTIENSGLYDQVRTISSISGGAWFASKLAFDGLFLNSIESMAQIGSHHGISQKYNDIFSKNLIELAQEAAQEYELLNALVPDSWRESVMLMLALKDDSSSEVASWWDFLERAILSGIPKNTTLGSQHVQNWARGKQWAIPVSIMTPPHDGQHANTMFRQKLRKSGPSKVNQLTYDSVGQNPPALFHPARFSVVLGGGMDSAPMPYSNDVGLTETELKYHGQCWCESFLCSMLYDAPQNYTITASSDIRPATLDFSDTPLYGAVGATSAAFGILSIMDGALTNKMQDMLKIDTSIWFSPTLEGMEAFDVPRAKLLDLWLSEVPLSDSMVREFAALKIHELTDGGWTDFHGVATAVASGATDVLVVMASESFGIDFYFTNNNVDQSQEYIIGSGWAPYLQVPPLFEQNVSIAIQSMKSSAKFIIPSTAQKLKTLEFVSIDVITTNNTLFGIEAGRSVSLHVFKPDTSLSVGLREDFADYGLLVADLVITLQDERNSAFVDQILQVLA